MEKLLFQLFCLLNLFFLHYATKYEENFSNSQAYDINYLLNSLGRLHNYPTFNEKFPSSLINFQFRNINPDFKFQMPEILHNSKCSEDILFLLLNLRKQPVVRMFDSFGKLESGILQGNIKWIGDYTECIQVHSSNPNSTVGNFHGKYCSVSWFLHFHNMSTPIPLINGICVPDSCSAAELQDTLEFLHEPGSDPLLNDVKFISNANITCKPTERHLNTPAKAVIALLSVFFALAVLGSSITAVKYFKKIIKESKDLSLIVNISESVHVIGDDTLIEHVESGDELLQHDNVPPNKINGCLDKLQAFLNCFCMFTNGAKLLNTDSSDGQLLCLHGIRFLSMSWVILGHTYGFGIVETRNLADAVKLVDNFPFQIVLQAFYAVDSFFVLSGFLVAYLTMKEYEKTNGVISWPYFYIHRYIRLTPLYMIVLGFAASVYFYIGSGPFWPDGDFDPICRDNWWYNLLYINNFIGVTEQCMSWAWYLANDMQFYIISPIFLISLWRWPKVGYLLLISSLCACCLSNFFITYHYDLMAGISDVIHNPNMTDYAQTMAKFFLYFNKLYEKPYTRISPYIIGMLTGYLIFKNNTYKKHKYSWVLLGIGWIVATAITLSCVYGLYHSHPSVLVTSFYNALNRTCFALGLSWVIYVCLIGQGGFVNSLLSYKFFIPLSRLTYAAYLIHPIILSAYYSSLKATIEFSHPSVVVTYLGIMVVTYGLSMPVALILEYPFASLEKLIIKAFSRNVRG